MTLRLLNIQDIVYETEHAGEVVIPVEGEELAVLDDHQSFVAAMARGTVRVTVKTSASLSEVHDFSISEGVATMHRNRMVIMTEGGISRGESK